MDNILQPNILEGIEMYDSNEQIIIDNCMYLPPINTVVCDSGIVVCDPGCDYLKTILKNNT